MRPQPGEKGIDPGDQPHGTKVAAKCPTAISQRQPEGQEGHAYKNDPGGARVSFEPERQKGQAKNKHRCYPQPGAKVAENTRGSQPPLHDPASQISDAPEWADTAPDPAAEEQQEPQPRPPETPDNLGSQVAFAALAGCEGKVNQGRQGGVKQPVE